MPGDDELDELRYRTRNTLFYGGEFSAELLVLEGVSGGEVLADLQLDWVRARFTSGSDRDVPRITPLRFGAGLGYQTEDFGARVGVFRVEEQDRTGQNESRSDGYTLVDVEASVRLRDDDALPLELSFAGRNLADVKGRNHVSFNKDEVRIQGRNFRVGLRGRF